MFLKLKNHELYNDNGQCYILGPDGFQYTRRWMNKMHGTKLADEIFDFCQRLRELDISESEFSIILPLHMCYHGKYCFVFVYYRIDFAVLLLDPNAENEEIIQMLRSCYLYALYVELCQNRGEIEGKRMCSKILQVRCNK